MEALNELILVIVALVTSLAMGGLTTFLAWVKALPGPAKSVAVLLLAAGAQSLAGVTGLDLPGDPFTWGGAALNTLSMWLIAQGAHAVKKTVAPKSLI